LGRGGYLILSIANQNALSSGKMKSRTTAAIIVELKIGMVEAGGFEGSFDPSSGQMTG